MTTAPTIARLADRVLFGDTAEDRPEAIDRTVSDFELAHVDPELEARLPRSGLDRPLATWSLAPGPLGPSAGGMTWLGRLREQARQAAVLGELDLRREAVSIGATCRVDPDDEPGRVVQATRYRGADEAALRRALPVPHRTRAVAGIELEEVAEVGAWVTPCLRLRAPGLRLVRGDAVFEVCSTDEAWVADVTDQLVNGWRCPAPSFAIDLPEGWHGWPATAANIEELARQARAADPARGDALAESAIETAGDGTTYMGLDLRPGSGPQPFDVTEYASWSIPFVHETRDLQRTTAARFGSADLEYVDLPAGLGARITLPLGDPGEAAFFAQAYIVRAGRRSYRFDFMSTIDRREADTPVFESIVRSLRVLSA